MTTPKRHPLRNLPHNKMRHNKPLPETHSKHPAIQINPSHEGELHQELHIADGKPIPADKLEQAAHSSNPKLKKQAVFAENAKHFNHK